MLSIFGEEKKILMVSLLAELSMEVDTSEAQCLKLQYLFFPLKTVQKASSQLRLQAETKANKQTRTSQVLISS